MGNYKVKPPFLNDFINNLTINDSADRDIFLLGNPKVKNT